MKTLYIITLLVVAGMALAITYRVDAEGGPDSLASEVNAAFDAWLGIDDSLELESSDEATTVFGYGEDSLFGPDILSLTVQRQDPSGVDILLRPTAAGRDNALLHETGLILGVSVAEAGVMNPALGDAAQCQARGRGVRRVSLLHHLFGGRVGDAPRRPRAAVAAKGGGYARGASPRPRPVCLPLPGHSPPQPAARQ